MEELEEERIMVMDSGQSESPIDALAATGSRRALVGATLAGALGLLTHRDEAAKPKHKKHKKSADSCRLRRLIGQPRHLTRRQPRTYPRNHDPDLLQHDLDHDSQQWQPEWR